MKEHTDFSKTDRVGILATILLVFVLLFSVFALQGCATTTGADGTQKPTITPQQQAQINIFLKSVVSGTVTYLERKDAVEAERHAYENAKKTAVQAAGIGAVVAYGKMHAGVSRDEAIAAGKLAAETWCATQGTTLEQVMAAVAKGAPEKVSTDDIWKGLLLEQIRYIEDQQADTP